MFLANLALLCGVSVDRVSATSDRRSMRERIVMGLYDNLDDKLFLYMREILHKTNIPPQVGKRGNAMSVSVCLVCLSISISQELHVQTPLTFYGITACYLQLGSRLCISGFVDDVIFAMHN